MLNFTPQHEIYLERGMSATNEVHWKTSPLLAVVSIDKLFIFKKLPLFLTK